MDIQQLIILLAISVGLTFVVGRLLVVAGEPFLQEVFEDKAVTRSVNLLLSVLFHLITLGVLAIVSSIELGTSVQAFIVRLGIVLIILGVAYGVSMMVLIRVRERRRADKISEHVQERLADRGVDARPLENRPDVTTRPVTPPQP